MEPYELTKIDEMTKALEKYEKSFVALGISLVGLSIRLQAALTWSFIKGLAVGGLIGWLLTRAF